VCYHVPYLSEHKNTLHMRQPACTIFSFWENAYTEQVNVCMCDYKVLDMFTKVWKATVWHPLDGFSWSFMFGDIFENLLKKFKFDYNMTRITGTLHEDICIFMVSCWMRLRKRNVSDKRCNIVVYSIAFSQHIILNMWDIMLSWLTVCCQRFRSACCFHPQSSLLS